MDTVTQAASDLTACDLEPIQFLGCIQPHGFLIEVSADWVVTRASANLDQFLPFTAAAALGRQAGDVLGANAMHDIRGQLQTTANPNAIQRVFNVGLGPDGRLIDVAVHRLGESLVVEGEPVDPADADLAETVQPLLMQLNGLRPLDRLLSQVARQVRVLSGFDRVMVYQFLPDGSGEVIAETRRAGMEPYKGLRYPATDIPKQARALYERNPIRVIADVDAAVVPVLPVLDLAGTSLDLSLSVLRAVSPIHLEYLRNMGVAASMSLSLLVDGKLWGLIACHNSTPRTLSLRCRTTLEFLCQMVNAILNGELRAQDIAHQAAARSLHTEILTALSSESATVDDIFPQLRQMQALLAADGLATLIEGHLRLSGTTPGESDIMALTQFLNRVVPSRVYTTHALPSLYPEAAAFAEVASGLLVVPISRKPRDFVMFFRGELVHQVTWAGDPVKQVGDITSGERISPRKSFAAWRETVRGQSAYWTEPQLQAAEALRVTLLETILQVTDRAEKQRKLSNDQQDLLIAELNHRVRNILNLIVGLVRQCSEGATSTAGLAEDISQRVFALARAHDQLTSSGWGARSIHGMVKVEAAAYLGSRADRVHITGPDMHVRPDAFTTLALVIHELITNAAKYGALRTADGVVTITIQHAPGSPLVLEWRETGGAAVTDPTRRGFGSTIIERAIPHELGGSATVRYAADGLRANFEIPDEYVAPPGQTDAVVAEIVTQAAPTLERLHGEILLVEDNLLIALETEDALRLLGADDVFIASTTLAALSYLQATRPAFALLDYNLGREQSAPVADRLIALGIPFVFATGYGDTAAIAPRFRGRPVLSKPYTSRAILQGFGAITEATP